MLWTDYFKPEHLEKYPELHDPFWNATKLAGEAKKSDDPAQGQKLLDPIAEIDKIFWESEEVVRAPDQLLSFASKEPVICGLLRRFRPT